MQLARTAGRLIVDMTDAPLGLVLQFLVRLLVVVFLSMFWWGWPPLLMILSLSKLSPSWSKSKTVRFPRIFCTDQGTNDVKNS